MAKSKQGQCEQAAVGRDRRRSGSRWGCRQARRREPRWWKARRIWKWRKPPCRSAWRMSQPGASDLTRAADAALVAERVQQLSDVVSMAGVMDVEEGVDMLMKGGDVRTMGAIVGLMSREELDRGMELARLAGELSVAGDVVDMLEMPVLAEFLADRGDAPARDRGRSTAALHEHAGAGRCDQGSGPGHRSHGRDRNRRRPVAGGRGRSRRRAQCGIVRGQ